MEAADGDDPSAPARTIANAAPRIVPVARAVLAAREGSADRVGLPHNAIGIAPRSRQGESIAFARFVRDR